jgi:hypothetical protein
MYNVTGDNEYERIVLSNGMTNYSLEYVNSLNNYRIEQHSFHLTSLLSIRRLGLYDGDFNIFYNSTW